jgi:hypothetical protein
VVVELIIVKPGNGMRNRMGKAGTGKSGMGKSGIGNAEMSVARAQCSAVGA